MAPSLRLGSPPVTRSSSPPPTLLLSSRPALSCCLTAGKYHDALVGDIRRGGSTRAYPWYNPAAELLGYIKNELYSPLFPGNQALSSGSSGGKAVPVNGKKVAAGSSGGRLAASAEE